MSNIPEARRLLQGTLRLMDEKSTAHAHVVEALALLDRKKPEFIARKVLTKLTWRQKQKAVALRSTGMSLHNIAVRLGTNIGRVSEAIKEAVDVG